MVLAEARALLILRNLIVTLTLLFWYYLLFICATLVPKSLILDRDSNMLGQ